MTTIHYTDVAVSDEGLATHRHVASHHVPGIPGGAEVTLCGMLIKYSAWRGTVDGAPECEECVRLDA